MANVFNYLNYRVFIRDFYLEQKARNKGFSYQKLAWKAGFRSKSFFKDVIEGNKNMSPASAFSVAGALGLEGESFSYFEALVAFNQVKTAAEKEHCFRKLAQYHKRGKSQLIAKDRFEFYSRWYHNTIRELATLVDFGDDYALLGRLVRPAISAGKARASVRLLLRLGLLIRERDRYRQADASVTTGDEIVSAAVGGFHVKNMGLASASLDTCPTGERDISCLVAGLSPAGFASVKSEIRAFRKKLVDLIRNDAPATRVYHINFQLFPTSEKTDA
jgi:uncharacterized protein (TIGR02147 family)